MKIIQEPTDRPNDQYPEFSESIRNTFAERKGNLNKLFTTNAEGLWELFLNNLPEEARQHYTCNACRRFVKRFGGLVFINTETKATTPAFWNAQNTPKFFQQSVKAIESRLINATVTGVFVASSTTLGEPTTGIWHHMHARIHPDYCKTSPGKTEYQTMAEKAEDFRILSESLHKYNLATATTAYDLLRQGILYRSIRFAPTAQWFLDLMKFNQSNEHQNVKRNARWFAVATAPTGFCHIGSSVVGTLLDDIADGQPIDSIKGRFQDKVCGTNYMRPQVAPTQGNIDQAEKIIADLGVANSLRRRYATIEEIPECVWIPATPRIKVQDMSGKIFGNIAAKTATPETQPIAIEPSVTMTWEKFKKTLLPDAQSIEAKVNPDRFMALVTAADPEAKNILQWGNTFSWYYHGGIDGEIKRRVELAGGKYESTVIRCSLIWEGYTDLDLHCITPMREHIHYASTRSNCGGWLDIDMNGGSHRDKSPVENIRWMTNGRSGANARSGAYRFYVHNYCERGDGNTPFRVELAIYDKVYSASGVIGRTGAVIDLFDVDFCASGAMHLSPVKINTALQIGGGNGFAVQADQFVKVNAITTSPNNWGTSPSPHIGMHTFFLLDGCKDTSVALGRGFFAETLKPEFREIRKTIEAYTAATPVEGEDNASACGVGYASDIPWNLTLKVKTETSTTIVKIDRFD